MTLRCVGKVPVGISNRHLHLSLQDLECLFGKDYKLTELKPLSQTGQFAAEETVIIRGPKGEIRNVRILGPTRNETQVEVSRTDSFGLGIKPPIRDSGILQDSPGLTLIGPNGSVEMKNGVIIAHRHIHMSEADAREFGVVDKERVTVKAPGERGLIYENVLVRVRNDFVLELHIDTDEANAAALANGELVEVLK